MGSISPATDGERTARFRPCLCGAFHDDDRQTRGQREHRAHGDGPARFQRHHQLHAGLLHWLAARKRLQFQSGFDHGQRFDHADCFHDRPHSAKLESPGWWSTSLGMLAGIFLLGGASRRRSGGRLLSLLVFAFLITIAGCGGGGGGSSGGGSRDLGTPLGTTGVAATVSSGNLTHSTGFTLIVERASH